MNMEHYIDAFRKMSFYFCACPNVISFEPKWNIPSFDQSVHRSCEHKNKCWNKVVKIYEEQENIAKEIGEKCGCNGGYDTSVGQCTPSGCGLPRICKECDGTGHAVSYESGYGFHDKISLTAQLDMIKSGLVEKHYGICRYCENQKKQICNDCEIGGWGNKPFPNKYVAKYKNLYLD